VIDWDAYFGAMRTMRLHPLYEQLEPHLPPPGRAIELGCGAGQGAEFFLDRGWTVTAIDLDPRAIDATSDRLMGRDGIDVLTADIAAIDFPRASAIAAGFVIFLLSAEQFEIVWSKIGEALRPGGVLLVQFLGPKDDWASQGCLSHSDAEIEDLLSDYEVLHFESVERNGKTAWGESKHWDVRHIIARKR
jgi:SAM-dependent methyltransferase